MRAIWKGAISFGLVHVPVSLYPVASESGIDFDWLDKRSMDPVGYKRINKRTGREIDKAHIVKGVKVDDGRYVVLGDDEIRAAYPKTTQTIAIQSFAKAAEIDFPLLQTPYLLAPADKGQKVYALLREAMRASGVLGIARFVLHTKEHLAVLVPTDSALVLNTLRWASDMRDLDSVELPPAGHAALQASELKMASRLIAEMTQPWSPEAHTDRFTAAVQALVERRAKAGKTEAVTPLEESVPGSSNVIDLSELLKQSLRGGRAGAKPRGKTPAKSAARQKRASASAAAKPARKRA